MPEVTIALAVSAFVAGLLMFLAPCTLPLVPAYLAFISGVNPDKFDQTGFKKKIIVGGLMFVLGFSLIFTSFGVLAGLFGEFTGSFRGILTQVGGLFIIIFGLMMLNVIRIMPLLTEHKLKLPTFITPGHPVSSFLIGSIFALGWTPCVGPILASVLLLATTSATAFSGGLLLLVFSAGLAVPFLLTALLYGRASQLISEYAYVSKWISRVGGLFLILIGTLLLFDQFGLTVEYGYRLFNFLGYDRLLDYY